LLTKDFFDLSYLATGSAVQQNGLKAITSLGILEMWKEYDPVVVGTLPLDLFTDQSDIDILCCYTNAEDFAEKLFFDLHRMPINFYINRKDLGGVGSVLTTFEYDGFQFEIVGQEVPVTKQVAFRHMVAEWQILSQNDDAFKQKIFELKQGGLKTEPAFAEVMGLKGDPYEALLQ
jgi:hypothetical protein